MNTEHKHTILGVEGRMFNRVPWPDSMDRCGGLLANQTWGASRPYRYDGANCTLGVEIRFDDNCKNGAQSFAITATIRDPRVKRDGGFVAGGCCHDDIADAFPELAPLIRWHLMDTRAPMHYVANAVYLAGDRDHSRRRKGDVSATQRVVYFGDSPIGHHIGTKFYEFLSARIGTGAFAVVAIAHEKEPGGYAYSPKYTFAGYGERWHECPFDDEASALQWADALNRCAVRFDLIPTAYSDGKERELDKARHAAKWPDATDEELCAEPDVLRAALLARLPALREAFRDAMVNTCGFEWRELQVDQVAGSAA